MSRVIVVGVAGVRRSGKNTVGNFLYAVHNFSQTAFADPLKKAAKICFPYLTEEQLYGSSQHREERLHIPLRGLDPRDGQPMRRVMDPAKMQYVWEAKDGTTYGEDLTPRLILQTLGTEWGRRLHKDIWTDAGWGHIENSSTYPWHRWVVTDCRFRNEFDAVRNRGGVMIKLLRGFDEAKAKLAEGNNADVHPSEREFLETPDDYFDTIVDNRGDISELPGLLDRALETLIPLAQERRDRVLKMVGASTL